MDLKALLKRGVRSAADLRAALAAIDHAGAAEELEAAEAARRALLLEGDDAAVLKAEQRISVARIAIDRARALEEELQLRIAEAEAAEAKAALDAEREAVEREAAATAKALKAYETHASAIVTLLQRLEAAEAAVTAINDKLSDAGRGGDCLAPVELRTFPAEGYAPAASVLTLTSLRPTATQPGFGSGKRTAGILGLKP